MVVLSAPILADERQPDVLLGSPPVATVDSAASAEGAESASDSRGDTADSDHTLFLPLIASTASDGLIVNPQDKGASSDFYHRYYVDSDETDRIRSGHRHSLVEATTHVAAVDPNWTGDHESCDAGDVAPEFRDAIMLRINYFRAMAGIPANVQFSDEYNRKAQQAALMMSVNRKLSHGPSSDWDCYTAEGAQGAGSANLFLGTYGWNAISGYIRDPGEGNFPAGHRRWILYPRTQWMGTGDIPPTDGYAPANALWVFDHQTRGPRPETREEFVAWPPPGYTPYQVTFPLWSFAYSGANFAKTSVTMTSAGEPIPLTLFEVKTGYGENTITWKPDIDFGRPDSDRRYRVQVKDVLIDGSLRDFSYDVIVFDPDP